MWAVGEGLAQVWGFGGESPEGVSICTVALACPPSVSTLAGDSRVRGGGWNGGRGGLVLALLSEGRAWGNQRGILAAGLENSFPLPLELLGHPRGTQRWAQHLRADTESGASRLARWDSGLRVLHCCSLCGAPRRWQLGEKPDPAGRRMDLQGSVCASGE